MKYILLPLLLWISLGTIQAQETWMALNYLGGEAYKSGDYSRASEIWGKAKLLAGKEFGEKSDAYITSCNNLAELYEKQHLYSKAEPLYLEVKNIYYEYYIINGNEINEYAKSCLNLANLYFALDLYDKAESLFLEIKEIYHKINESYEYSKSLSNLVRLYYKTGEYNKAGLILLELENYSDEPEEIGLHFHEPSFLGKLAWLYYKRGNYAKAEKLFITVLENSYYYEGEDRIFSYYFLHDLLNLYLELGLFDKIKSLSNKIDISLYLNNAFKDAKTYFDNGFYEAAEVCALIIIDYYKIIKHGKEEHMRVMMCYEVLGDLYTEQGLSDKAEASFLEIKNIMGKKFKFAFNFKFALLYDEQGLYDKAEKLYLVSKNTIGKKHSFYIAVLNNLALIYIKQGVYEKAEIIQLEAKNIIEKKHNYDTFYNNLAEAYFDFGLFIKAESFYLEDLKLTEKIFGKEANEYATALCNLANLYQTQGLYGKAEKLFLESLKIIEKALNKEHPEYISSLVSLANLYQTQGLYDKAEKLFLETLSIKEKVLGKEDPKYAINLYDLTGLYQDQGLYGKAEKLFLEALAIKEKVLDEEDSERVDYLYNFVSVYTDQGLYDNAEKLIIKAKNTIERKYSKENSYYNRFQIFLANIYQKQGLYNFAEALLLEAKKIYEKDENRCDPCYVFFLRTFSNFYQYQGLYDKAEPLIIEAKNIYQKIWSRENPNYATTLNDWAELYAEQGLFAQATPLYQEASRVLIGQTESNFAFLSEKEKGEFLNTFKYNFEIFNSFTLQASAQIPDLTGWIYNNALATKGLLFQSSQKIRARILASGDAALIALFETWRDKRAFLTKLATLPIEEKKVKGIDEAQLEAEANDLEKQLSLKSDAFATGTAKTCYTWQDVQKALQPGEAAVEIIRTRYYDRKFTDSVLYIALIVRPETQGQPEMVVMDNGKEMEGKYLNFYRNRNTDESRKTLGDEFSYGVYWAKIQEKLTGIQKVYVSADGVYHQISLAALFNPATQKYLLDKINLQMLSNSKDLVQFAQKLTEQQNNYTDYRLYLMGYPQYDDNTLPKDTNTRQDGKDRAFSFFASPLIAAFESGKDSTATRFFDRSTGRISLLPGTKAEVEFIQQMAQAQNMPCTIRTDKEANEENLKKADNPTILHVATHGFFLSDVELERIEKTERGGVGAFSSARLFSNPLLRSGLLLAGAESSLKGVSFSGKEDGILTAAEVQNLALDQTDLVVLSACQTGLGTVSNGEGVYGLQRAFRQAGAKSLLMTLWSVNDAATTLMMQTFYENLLVKKQSKREAFNNAIQTLRGRYPEPYYWAPFVMVGE